MTKRCDFKFFLCDVEISGSWWWKDNDFFDVENPCSWCSNVGILREDQELNNWMCCHNLYLETKTQTFMLHVRPRPQTRLFVITTEQPGLAVSNTPIHTTVLGLIEITVFVLCFDSVLWKHIQMLTPGLFDLLHLNNPSFHTSAPISGESWRRGNKNDFTTHIELSKLRKITVPQNKKILLFVPVSTCHTNLREEFWFSYYLLLSDKSKAKFVIFLMHFHTLVFGSSPLLFRCVEFLLFFIKR